MEGKERAGKIQTVLGLIKEGELGITLMHEHLLFDMCPWFIKPTNEKEEELAYQTLSLENISWSRNHRFHNVDNMFQQDIQLAIKEARLFKEAGGSTIVEVSNVGLSRNPQGLVNIAKSTGLNIIMGCGYYVGISHPKDMHKKTEKQITQEIVQEVLVGVGDTDIRAGIIGEIGCSQPLEDGERKVLRACAAAQRLTGAALSLHSSPSVLEIISILKDAGADLSRTIVGHVAFTYDTCRQLLDAGCYLQYDNIGHLGYPHILQGHLIELSGDLVKVYDIIRLIREGFINQILLSHDVCFKDCLVTYGGNGYAHILENLLPILRFKGVTEEQINTLLIENPNRVLKLASVS